jgi:GT2 family glycosyltransferase
MVDGEYTSEIIIVICTKNRNILVENLLKAIDEFTVSPKCVYIIDSSDSINRIDIRNLKTPVIQLFCELNSLPSQRNLFMDLAIEKKMEMDFICFLDDDVLPDENYLGEMIKIFKLHKEFIGLAPLSYNPNKSEIESKNFLKLQEYLQLDSASSGKLLKSGINVGVRNIDRNREVVESDWITGVSIWKYETIKHERFPGQFRNSGLFEDVWFSHQNVKFGKIAFCPRVKIVHFESNLGRENIESYFVDWVFNRYKIVNQILRRKSRLFFHLTTFIVLTREILRIKNTFEKKCLITKGVLKGYKKIILS